jgi:hypothetical protein
VKFQDPSDRCTPFAVTPVAQRADFFVRHLLGGSVSNAATERSQRGCERICLLGSGPDITYLLA